MNESTSEWPKVDLEPGPCPTGPWGAANEGREDHLKKEGNKKWKQQQQQQQLQQQGLPEISSRVRK